MNRPMIDSLSSLITVLHMNGMALFIPLRLSQSPSLCEVAGDQILCLRKQVFDELLS